MGEVATQNIRGRTKLVGIDVILVHRLLKNSVAIPEYVLVSEELYSTDDERRCPRPVHEITPELEGIGDVRAYFVDVADLDGLAPAAGRADVACAAGQHVRRRRARACPTCSA